MTEWKRLSKLMETSPLLDVLKHVLQMNCLEVKLIKFLLLSLPVFLTGCELNQRRAEYRRPDRRTVKCTNHSQRRGGSGWWSQVRFSGGRWLQKNTIHIINYWLALVIPGCFSLKMYSMEEYGTAQVYYKCLLLHVSRNDRSPLPSSAHCVEWWTLVELGSPHTL